MKKNLTIIAIALVVLAMAVPASAASLSLTGKAVAGFKYDYSSGNEAWNFETLATNSRLELKLTFKEGDKITAYLPLVVRPVLGTPTIYSAHELDLGGGWYFAYDSAPVAFWVSSNDADNVKQWAPLGDPMKVVNDMPAGVLLNVNGEVLGAKFNLYSADLGTSNETITYKVGAIDEYEDAVWVPERDENGDPVLDDEGDPVYVRKVDTVEISQPYSNGNAWVGRITYPLPFDFTLGAFGVYTDGRQEKPTYGPDPVNGEYYEPAAWGWDSDMYDELDLEEEFEGFEKLPTITTPAIPDELIFGGDLVGKIPALGEKANLTLALAGQWTKEGAWKFEGGTDNLAYTARLNDIQVGPVSAWARYTAVGADFNSPYKIPTTIDRDRYKGEILNKYAGSAAAEAEVAVDLPIGIPAKLTIGDTYWMDYPTAAKYNATTGKIAVTPLEGLSVIVSGAYRVDLNEDDDHAGTIGDPDDPAKRMYDGYKAKAEIKYGVFGLTLNPFAYYEKDSYADWAHHGTDNARVDTGVGLNVSGSPLAGLDLNLESEYVIEDKDMYALAWGVYTSEFNPGFVKSAMTKIAGVGEYAKAGDDDAETDLYAYFGSDIVITDQLSAKVGALTKDYAEKLVAHAALTYKVSDSVTSTLAYTYRGSGEKVSNYDSRWRPFDDDGKNFFKASVKGTVGKSTITLAYGNAGLSLAPCDYANDCDMDEDFHVDKPWTWLYHKPGFAGWQQNFMNWQLFSISCSVPF